MDTRVKLMRSMAAQECMKYGTRAAGSTASLGREPGGGLIARVCEDLEYSIRQLPIPEPSPDERAFAQFAKAARALLDSHVEAGTWVPECPLAKNLDRLYRRLPAEE